jgi:hypothetical protein
MRGVHLLKDRERIRMLLCRNAVGERGVDGFRSELSARRDPQRNGRVVRECPRRPVSERRSAERRDERREVGQILQWVREQPAFDGASMKAEPSVEMTRASSRSLAGANESPLTDAMLFARVVCSRLPGLVVGFLRLAN